MCSITTNTKKIDINSILMLPRDTSPKELKIYTKNDSVPVLNIKKLKTKIKQFTANNQS